MNRDDVDPMTAERCHAVTYGVLGVMDLVVDPDHAVSTFAEKRDHTRPLSVEQAMDLHSTGSTLELSENLPRLVETEAVEGQAQFLVIHGFSPVDAD